MDVFLLTRPYNFESSPQPAAETTSSTFERSAFNRVSGSSDLALTAVAEHAAAVVATLTTMGRTTGLDMKMKKEATPIMITKKYAEEQKENARDEEKNDGEMELKVKRN